MRMVTLIQQSFITLIVELTNDGRTFNDLMIMFLRLHSRDDSPEEGEPFL
jgi:hypothetical protein